MPPASIGNWILSGCPQTKSGQGQIFEYSHQETHDKAILKFLKYPDNPIAVERFIREVTVLSEIKNPNVIEVIAADISSHSKWYLMPQGVPFMEQWKSIRERCSSPIEIFNESVPIILGLITGLCELHKREFAHRDIKPQNIIFYKNNPVLIDLGLVYHPTFTGITDSRGVGNRFLDVSRAIKEPYYLDCFFIVCIWAWMLRKITPHEFNHYHWRYVELAGAGLEFDLVRSLLAWVSYPHDINAYFVLEYINGRLCGREGDQIMNKKRLELIDQAQRAIAASAIEKELELASKREMLYSLFMASQQTIEDIMTSFVSMINETEAKTKIPSNIRLGIREIDYIVNLFAHANFFSADHEILSLNVSGKQTGKSGELRLTISIFDNHQAENRERKVALNVFTEYKTKNQGSRGNSSYFITNKGMIAPWKNCSSQNDMRPEEFVLQRLFPSYISLF